MAVDVLVVDDSSVMREVIIKTLRLSDLPLGEIYQAANGAEGLEIICDHRIDLVLVNINMPVMDGEKMFDILRKTPETKDIPVVIVSTESSKSRIAMLQGKGAEFVHKPFTPEMLRKTVRNLLGDAYGGHR